MADSSLSSQTDRAANLLWYDTPAATGVNEALPIGNGRLGGLIYGAPNQERVVLNEDSLWTGTQVSSDDYGRMGSYQVLGELLTDFGQKASGVSVSCPSGQKAFYQDEEIAAVSDGSPQTKWCVEYKNQPLIWELRLPEPKALHEYTFVSASDVPSRDPSTWNFSGSNDGKIWTVLDHHENEPSFEQRGQTKTFTCKNADSFKIYRLTFAPNPNDPRFQLAEIAITGSGPVNQEPVQGVQGYRRSLDISTAVHNVVYKSNGVTFGREAFASHPDEVMALRFTADRRGSVTGAIKLCGSHGEKSVADDHSLTFTGTLSNGLKYETSVLILNDGGTIKSSDDKVECDHCDSITVLLAAGTDYVMDYNKHYRGDDPHEAIVKRLESAKTKGYAGLKASHISDFQSLFSRVKLTVGTTGDDRIVMPTNKRKVVYSEKGGDPGLEETMFQYGRYLLISCSRPGGLPANLQGLWNDSNDPPWHCDYHANINVQMNYWLAEPSNLSECHTPLFELINSQLKPWRKATADEKRFQLSNAQVQGWAVRTSHGINGDQGWDWDVTANAWYCQHFWMHYAFTGDKKWLRSVAYPVMKETCQFWKPRLKKLGNGKLVVPNGWSPEHGPHEDGVSYNQQIVWDLFNNYVQSATVLNIDPDFRDEIAKARDALLGPQIGQWGQLQEWMTDRDDPNDHHRHTSHLFAVFPGRQIDVFKMPELAAAARKSLVARGVASDSDVREWSFAWRSSLYARLRDGEGAHQMLQMLLADRNTCPNLFGLHPPMQMDGNFGITAGICEMLMQSTGDEIDLLPALPSAWPNGKINGLCARGGFTVDLEWKDGIVAAYHITSANARPVDVRCNGKLVKIMSTENAKT